MKSLLVCFCMSATLCCADSLNIALVDQNGDPLGEAAIVLTGEHMPVAQPREATVNQIDENFVPRVTLVATGSTVNFPNQDQILHHVYSFSDAATFEVPLYAGTPASPVLLDQPGLVTLGCNIHDWMQAWILVTDSPWAGITDEFGEWRVDDLPAGTYEMQVWHPDERRPRQAQNVEVSGDIELDLAIETRPRFNLRNLPGAGGGYF